MTGMVLAPLFVPVELVRLPGREGRRAAGPALRYFRLAVGLDDAGDCLRLRSAVPDELRSGLIQARFHLPPPTAAMAKLLDGAWEGEVVVTAEASTVIIDAGTERERPEARLLVFRSVLAPVRELLVQYATLRLEGE